MFNKIKIITLILGSLLVISQVKAQSPTLEAYVQEGLKSNLTLQQRAFDLKKQQERLNQARALFLPQLSLDASYTRADGGRTIDFPVGDLLNPVYDALDRMSGSDVFPTITNVNEQLLPNDFHDTKVRLIQPLFNADIYFNRLAQENLVSAEEARKASFENELAHNIRSAYYQYLQAIEAEEIYMHSREVLDELVRVNKSLVANDKATYDIIYSAESELADLEADLIKARKNVNVSRSYFNFLLNRELDEPITVDESVKWSGFVFESAGELASEAFGQRQELKQLSSVILANQNLLNLNKNAAYLPKLNLVLDGGFQGFGYSFDNNQDYWLAQLSLSWNLFKGGEKKSKIRESRYELERLNSQQEQLKDQIELQVITAYNEYQAALESVMAGKKRAASAQKSFNIIQKKYRENQVILVEYLEARNQYTTSQLSLSIAEYDALIKASTLRKVISKN